MNADGAKGFLRDMLLAVGIAFIAWFVWIQFMAPRPASSGPAPAFELASVAGETIRLDQHADDIVVLNFWFTSCPPCRREIPQLAAFHTANPDIPFYGVSVDGMATKRLGVVSKKLGINYPVLHDVGNVVSQRYGVTLFPTTIVIAKGEIVGTRMGEITRERLQAMVDDAK